MIGSTVKTKTRTQLSASPGRVQMDTEKFKCEKKN